MMMAMLAPRTRQVWRWMLDRLCHDALPTAALWAVSWFLELENPAPHVQIVVVHGRLRELKDAVSHVRVVLRGGVHN